jgi:hypothetical protein
VIRTIALGVVCLAGLGVIGPAARSSPPEPADVVFPVVAGDKADRLPIHESPQTLADADKVNVAYVAPAEERLVSPSQPLPLPATREAIGPAPRNFIPRHWHDPHDPKSGAAQPAASVTNRLKKRSAERPTEQARDVKDCRSDGLQPILRKLNLSSPCSS